MTSVQLVLHGFLLVQSSIYPPKKKVLHGHHNTWHTFMVPLCLTEEDDIKKMRGEWKVPGIC